MLEAPDGASNEILLRYSRHILLDEIGVEGQDRISRSTVLIVGAGGLGCPAALYLAGAGVGTLILADGDHVDLTNLQRQVLHVTQRIGMTKVLSAKIQLNALNPHVQINTLESHLEGEQLEACVRKADLVLDCCDNFKTRYALNRACVMHKKPLVSGAALKMDGQLACFNLADPNAPCYHCLFPEAQDVQEVRCATMGVLAPLTGVIGALQATEALKILAGFGRPQFAVLQIFDACTGEFTRMQIRQDPACPVCASRCARLQTV